MLGRWIVVGALLAVVAAATSPAGAQSSAACDPGRNAPVTWSAQDRDSKGGATLYATHTLEITMTPDASTGEIVDDTTVKLSLPAGVTVFDASSPFGRERQYDSERVGIQTDTPGPITVAASWDQDDVNGRCSGSSSATFQVQAAAPLRLGTPPKRRIFRLDGGWVWNTSIPPGTDLRPLEVRARSVKKAHLPGAALPFKTMSIGLRVTEPRFDQGERRLRVPRLLFGVDANNETIRIRADMRIGSIREKPVGYEVQFVQAGRQLGRIRMAGRCGVFDCKVRTIKVER